MRGASAAVALLLAACTALPPMRHRIDAGEDAYVVFVADAPSGKGDLWAMHAGGGEAVQLTFTRPAESRPALNPTGEVVAFLRATGGPAGEPAEAWLLNLLNGAERRLELPDEAGRATAIAWTADGRQLLVRTATGTWRLDAPPARAAARLVPAAELVTADSAFAVFVGRPPFARIDRCAAGTGLCVVGATGESSLAPGGREPVAWGADSVAFLEGSELIVRPAGPGRARRVRWPSRLDGVREATAFLGR